MEGTAIYKLVNPEFEFEFNGKQYKIRKANLEKAIKYQAKAQEFFKNKEDGYDLKLAAYCIYLVLSDQEPELTYEKVLEVTPGDIDPMECFVTLGFMNPKKAEMAKRVSDSVVEKAVSQTTEESSS